MFKDPTEDGGLDFFMVLDRQIVHLSLAEVSHSDIAIEKWMGKAWHSCL
jgi:hypothetical protein